MLTHCYQLLSIACDNASPNNTTIMELVDLVLNFPGDANHTQCFAHISNLVAKHLTYHIRRQTKL
ncbi:hypothetical protein FIBSPDRAFT_756940 [Athelia psychrophila]|uniref:MULE transposase domain-containing protein n=1 Tax=Athelia psychrophila TaxID=1759441 RepID=A0A166A606_9AGAM|nr:hypothetical protein FIBSPDRAFT_756940 [Fibularhizoctonia sp. CBS 109695]